MVPSHDNGVPPPGDRPPSSVDAGTGSAAQLDDVFPAIYEELRRVAHRQLRGERTEHTLGTTALVHEAYLELLKLDRIRWHGRAYVLAAASQAMRRVLIDYAVSRRAQKRGGGMATVPLDDAFAMAVSRGDELLALDEALDRLAALDPRAARVVECRFFGGLSEAETAEALGVSRRTAAGDWLVARGWLYQALRAQES